MPLHIFTQADLKTGGGVETRVGGWCWCCWKPAVEGLLMAMEIPCAMF